MANIPTGTGRDGRGISFRASMLRLACAAAVVTLQLSACRHQDGPLQPDKVADSAVQSPAVGTEPVAVDYAWKLLSPRVVGTYPASCDDYTHEHTRDIAISIGEDGSIIAPGFKESLHDSDWVLARDNRKDVARASLAGGAGAWAVTAVVPANGANIEGGAMKNGDAAIGGNCRTNVSGAKLVGAPLYVALTAALDVAPRKMRCTSLKNLDGTITDVGIRNGTVKVQGDDYKLDTAQYETLSKERGTLSYTAHTDDTALVRLGFTDDRLDLVVAMDHAQNMITCKPE